MSDQLTDVLAWFFGLIAVVSFIWAVRSSIQLARASRRAKETLEAILADENMDPEFKQRLLQLNMSSHLLKPPLPERIKRRGEDG